MFEALQGIQDTYNEETRYDDFVNQENGDIKVNQVCETLSVALWGLVMAKAKASFALSDLTDSKLIKQKFSKLIYLGVMVFFAQILKLSAENNYVNHFITQVEIKIDSAVNLPSNSTSHGPVVSSSHFDLQSISEFRQQQVSDSIFSGETNDFNIIHRTPNFDIDKVQSQIADKITSEKSTESVKVKESR